MKNRQINFLVFILISFLGYTASAQEETKEDLAIPLTNPSKEGRIDINLTYGSISVMGYDGKEVLVTAVTSNNKHHYDDDDSRDGLKRIGNNSFNISASEEDNRVKISTGSWNQRMKLVVKVPKNFSAKLYTVNDGNIFVENLEGEIDLHNVNGDVTAKNISGIVTANTVNGDVTISMNKVTPDIPMAFSSLNGDLDITFPSKIQASLKMKSDRGDIYTDFDLKSREPDPVVEKERENGVYRVKIEKWVYGDLNGGGPEILLKTMNGDIMIREG